MNRIKRSYMFLVSFLLPLSLFAVNVSGTVSDATTGSALDGANVTVEGTDLGAAAGGDGSYSIANVPAGATVTASMIGYTSVSATAAAAVNFELEVAPIQLVGLDVIATKAKHRETPVAFSNVTREELKIRVASRDLPMILNETPGVYASMQAGGSGDSRVNVRGFDQMNTAILINGVPVNDMENGWVYWSNWDGMADVTSSIQIQRGLGATNLAIASVGGTVDVRTSAAELKRGFGFKQELGSDSFYKSTFTFNTGRSGGGLATSVLLQRKTGNGWVDGTWTDAWAYFLTMNKVLGNHSFDISLLGAPQQHGQRDGDNQHTAADWEAMNDVESGYGSKDSRRVNTGGSGSGWGYVSAENAESIKMGTDESIDAIPDMLFGGIQHTKKIGDKWIINNRTNYYHKPVYSLNWHWEISENTSLSTVFYGSNGRGGGTGPLNSRGKVYLQGYFAADSGAFYIDSTGTYVDADSAHVGTHDYHSEYEYYKYINPNHNDDETFDWDDIIAYNQGNDGTGHFENKMYFDLADSAAWQEYTASRWGENAPYDTTYSSTEIRSKYIIRASVNHHDWYGAISTLKHTLSDNLKLSTGIDVRTYAGEHYREVVNLLGGDYFIDIYGNTNDDTNEKKMKKIGDKIAYHNIGYNNWMGGFGQVEYTSDQLSAFASAAFSNTTYQREDFHNYTPDEGQLSEKASFLGSAMKIGANYNINDAMNVFANVGALSVAPKFRNVYLNYVNDINPNAKNENIQSTELGFGYRTGSVQLNANYYYTKWMDKSMVKSSNNLIYNIDGLNAVHSGVELDFAYALMRNLKLTGAMSFANWTWESDVVADVTSDDDRGGDTYHIEIYAGGLHVGDAPQTQMSYGINYEPIKGLTINPVVKYYDKHYADFDPADRDDSTDEADAYQLPAVTLIDLHARYALNIGSLPLEIGFHLLNATDAEYVSDAQDGSGHDEASSKVFYGLGQRFNLNLNIRF